MRKKNAAERHNLLLDEEATFRNESLPVEQTYLEMLLTLWLSNWMKALRRGKLSFLERAACLSAATLEGELSFSPSASRCSFTFPPVALSWAVSPRLHAEGRLRELDWPTEEEEEALRASAEEASTSSAH